MLAAAVLGLILPSLEYGGKFALLITVAGIFAGALCLNLIDKLVPHLHKLVGQETEQHNNANVLCLPARFVDKETAIEIVKTFLSTSFDGGRHQTRIEKIPV